MKRIVVVGTEVAVRAHTERYRRFDDATVCGIVGIDTEPSVDAESNVDSKWTVGADDSEGGDTVGSPDAPRYESLPEALETTDRSADVDGVDICGSGASHADALETTLELGVPVRCDPPFALDAERHDRLVSTATESDGWLVAHSPHRFSRIYDRLHSAVESGGIGDIGVARVGRTAPFDGPRWNVSYAGVRAVESHAEALCSVLAHDVDVLEWTFGPVERTFVRTRESERCDHAHAVFAFQEGGRATVEVRWHRTGTPAPRVGVEYSGKHGRLDFDEADALTAFRSETTPLAVDPPKDDCRGRALRAFLDRLDGTEAPPTGVAPATPSRVVVAARRSAAEGRPITLVEGSP
ncbi:Gfo/Idh/MocA family protein [Halegenticoccus tardaugens]|uniref:Gfo/Idh/MocA family protein n=1 Tax=Halegenticoccus tardaugens TaxID=2071624 RepID=UPI00100B8A8C|nr:Gfo/Idh/MocA family oxidoreductase [Halegenticoccus tardaugens]